MDRLNGALANKKDIYTINTSANEGA